MIMKNIFNGKRFMALLKKEALDLRSQYLKIILIMACTFLVIFFLFAFFGKDNFADYAKTRFTIGNMFIWICTLIAPFQLYKRFNHKIYGVNYFMLPASQTEKWLSMLFYCVIVTPVVLILTITLIDLCLYPFYPWAEKSLWFNSPDFKFSSDQVKLVDAIMTFIAFQSLVLLGNIWFQRAKMQKTIAAIIVLFVVHLIFMLILTKLFGEIKFANGSSGIGLSMSFTARNMLGFPKVWGVVSMIISYLIAPIGLWIVSFMKMKEQQL
jgi:hypothetical protein